MLLTYNHCEQNRRKHNEPIGLYDDIDEIHTTAAINEDLQHTPIYIHAINQNQTHINAKSEGKSSSLQQK